MTTGGVRLEFPAETLDEAVEYAQMKYREIVGDPEGKLPWSAHFEFYEKDSEGEGGEPNKPVMMVQVRIEFDRRDDRGTSAAV